MQICKIFANFYKVYVEKLRDSVFFVTIKVAYEWAISALRTFVLEFINFSTAIVLKLKMLSRKDSSVNDVFLIGSPIDQFPQSFLPTNHDVLSRHFYYLKWSKETIKESCGKTSEEVLEVWKTASIPTILKSSIMKKIFTIYKQWSLLYKNIKRKTTCQKNKENIFSSSLKNLFDVSSKEKILDPHIEQFLIDQRTERIFTIKSFTTPRKSSVSIIKHKGMFTVFLLPAFKKLYIS